MESLYSNQNDKIFHYASQIIESCRLIGSWNKNINSSKEYLYSDEAIEKMAASCMMLETIGELVKKIDKIMPDYLSKHDFTIPWNKIMRLRDRIAHGYFDLDEDIIFDIVKNDVPVWEKTLSILINKMK